MSHSRPISKNIKVISFVIFSIIAIIYILPLIITFSNSLMSQSEISRNYSIEGDIFHPGEKFIDMNIIPENATLSQYILLLLKALFI